MNKVIVYTTQYCPYCTRAKNLLKRKKIDFQEVDITNDPEKREELERKTDHMTVPMIFIGKRFIGGADDLYGLEQSGELDRILSGK